MNYFYCFVFWYFVFVIHYLKLYQKALRWVTNPFFYAYNVSNKPLWGVLVIIPLGFEFNSRRLDVMGDFEVFFIVVSTLILSVVIYNLLNSFMFRNLIRRFGMLKQTRKDFYECGFRPVTQKPICLPIPFLLICVFFLLYDIELIYLFPLVSTEEYLGFYETLLLLFFFFILFVGLIFDFTRHALYWQY